MPLSPSDVVCLSPACSVKEFAISRGLSWVGSVANTACPEADYYEELVRYYRGQKRVSACSASTQALHMLAGCWVGGRHADRPWRASRTHSGRPVLLAHRDPTTTSPTPPPPPQLFPYHLGEFVCRQMRLTPFKYYASILVDAMREDHPYDSIPNFTVGCLELSVAGGSQGFRPRREQLGRARVGASHACPEPVPTQQTNMPPPPASSPVVAPCMPRSR